MAFSLTTLRRQYAHVPALAADPHPSVDAEQVTRTHLDELHSWAQIFYDVTLDGVLYSYDRERLGRLREQGRLPIVCVENVEALAAFEAESTGWLPVLLWCPRDEAAKRSTHGWPVEEPDRRWSRRWERSTKGLLADPGRFTLTVRSDRLDAVEIARIVHLAAQAGSTNEHATSTPPAASHR
ncbi:hypothetical protein ACFFOU_13235 [Pseudonocardia sulfidoxydans]|uniref:hypothetical protein n=1 Tax=Pseudonocardia sulfidoxydans TaxID=54011 RepID=UPI0011BF49D7|nr:hypothetical protein [Pseudonocardia sulfidoxydans]